MNTTSNLIPICDSTRDYVNHVVQSMLDQVQPGVERSLLECFKQGLLACCDSLESGALYASVADMAEPLFLAGNSSSDIATKLCVDESMVVKAIDERDIIVKELNEHIKETYMQ